MEKEVLFGTFDAFLISQMGFSLSGTLEQQEKIRKEAYHTFLNKIRGERPASFPTIRRWFGIRSVAVPAREQIFRIAFSLGCNVEQTNQYLVEGASQPSFQINDYTEMIAMYALENGWNWEKYQKIVGEYEGGLDDGTEILHQTNTQWLMQQFEYVKTLDEEQFMYWMWKHSGIFKGYSKTAQEFLTKYRQLVLEGMRNDAKNNLDSFGGKISDVEKRHFIGRSANELEQIKSNIGVPMNARKILTFRNIWQKIFWNLRKWHIRRPARIRNCWQNYLNHQPAQ
ncbi:MAG: hypothetical protein ACLTS6_04065 [Anaerobutyricum sp.]